MSEAPEKKAEEKGAEKAKAPKAKKAPSAQLNETKKKKDKWTQERCQRVAKRFANLAEWQQGAPSSFKAAEAKGWVKNCSAHMGASKPAGRDFKKSA